MAVVRPQRPVGLLLLAWTAVSLGIAWGNGTYRPGALAAEVVAVVLLFVAVLAPARRFPARFDAAGYAAAALLVAVGGLVGHPHYYAHGPWFVVATACAAVAALIAASTVWREWPHAFAVAFAFAVAAGVAIVVAAPHPHIDVWFLLQDSTRGLVEGRDMYRQSWPGSTGLYAVYPYLPVTSVLLLPARLLFGDVRYGLVAALALAALWLRRLPGTGRASAGGEHAGVAPALLPLLVLVLPKATFAIQQSWTEPLLIAALVGMVAAMRAGRRGLAVLALAVALASKQHIALLLPLAACWPAFGVRRTVWSGLLALVLVAPWLAAGPADFWHDAVSVNLGYPPLTRALDLPALALRHGVHLGLAVTALALLAAYVAGWRCRGDAFGFAAGSALVLQVLDVTNVQSFFNHYTLVLGLLALAACLAVSEPAVARAGASIRESPAPGREPAPPAAPARRAPGTAAATSSRRSGCGS